MGETKKSAQDNPPEPGLSSGEPEGSTPAPETPKTFTEEQVQKAVSDALAKAGRTDKKFAQREAAIKAREEAADARQTDLDGIQRRLDEAEFNAVKGDPDLEARFKSKKELEDGKRQLATDRQKFEQEKAQHQAVLEAAQTAEKEIAIWEIAQKYGVDANTLKELNLETPEQIESVAKAMSAGKPKEPTPPGSEPDSGKTKGGGLPTPEQLEASDMPTYAAQRKQLRKAKGLPED